MNMLYGDENHNELFRTMFACEFSRRQLYRIVLSRNVLCHIIPSECADILARHRNFCYIYHSDSSLFALRLPTARFLLLFLAEFTIS